MLGDVGGCWGILGDIRGYWGGIQGFRVFVLLGVFSYNYLGFRPLVAVGGGSGGVGLRI